MKRTPLHDVHKALNAKMIEFAGYEMPVEYTGVKDEHKQVREKAGVFDVSHMGEFRLKGPDAFKLVQHLTSNDATRLVPGKVQYTCLPNGRGGIVDDLLLYMIGEHDYMMVVNAANIEKDWKWINSQNNFDVELLDISENTALIAVQGPMTADILNPLTDIDLNQIKFHHFTIGEIGGLDEVLISATGYTGSGGFELYCRPDQSYQLWNRIMESGASADIKPAGLAARDTLRLEMGFCLYGNDIDETTSPLEAGLGWITKFTEGNDFIDRQRLEEQKINGVARKLIGFEMMGKGIPRKDYPILDPSGKVMGRVTSGTMSPTLEKGIGMGYLPLDFSNAGQEILIGIREKQLRARVIQLPFYKK